MRTKVCKWGNSLAIRLPAEITRNADILEGDTLPIEVDEWGTVTIRKRQIKITLANLVDGITPENIHGETR